MSCAANLNYAFVDSPLSTSRANNSTKTDWYLHVRHSECCHALWEAGHAIEANKCSKSNDIHLGCCRKRHDKHVDSGVMCIEAIWSLVSGYERVHPRGCSRTLKMGIVCYLAASRNQLNELLDRRCVSTECGAATLFNIASMKWSKECWDAAVSNSFQILNPPSDPPSTYQ